MTEIYIIEQLTKWINQFGDSSGSINSFIHTYSPSYEDSMIILWVLEERKREQK
uniref:Uncharacterized protein n=1 Tax=Siphoviridae sp. ctTnV63 TaxID=2825523 RepID=A0A8S5NWJ3_9CAUD|nr:MAG TPA: hypothetical protein [Siphoviridae sp. ctTnV63]